MFISAGSKETSYRKDIKKTISEPAQRLDNSVSKLDSSLNILMKKI